MPSKLVTLNIGKPSFSNHATPFVDANYLYGAILSSDRYHVHIARVGLGENGITRTVDLPHADAQALQLFYDVELSPNLLVYLLCNGAGDARRAEIWDSGIPVTLAIAPAPVPASSQLDRIENIVTAIAAKVGV